MRKVLKSTARVVVRDSRECVRLYFQYNKEIKPMEDGPIKIYRKLDTGFTFDWDEMEYFDGMLPSDEDLIFEGEIPVINTFCEYIDRDVELGRVYVYWIVKGDSTPAGPLAVKIRDSRIWWSYERIAEEVMALKRDFPEIEVIEEGRSVLGKPLYAIYAGNPDKRIVSVGAVHAGESGPEFLLPNLRRLLAEEAKLIKRVGVAVFPVVSADNRDAMAGGVPPYIRKNAAGVDLNRNFDSLWDTNDTMYGLSSLDPMSPTYHGLSPNSEPEVRAVISCMEKANPVAVFSYHHLCSVTSDRALTAFEAEGDTEFLTRANAITKVYSEAFRAVLGAQRSDNTDAVCGCSVGSLPSWCYSRGIPCFDFEMSPTTPSLHCGTHDVTTPEALKSCADSHYAATLKCIQLFA